MLYLVLFVTKPLNVSLLYDIVSFKMPRRQRRGVTTVVHCSPCKELDMCKPAVFVCSCRKNMCTACASLHQTSNKSHNFEIIAKKTSQAMGFSEQDTEKGRICIENTKSISPLQKIEGYQSRTTFPEALPIKPQVLKKDPSNINITIKLIHQATRSVASDEITDMGALTCEMHPFRYIKYFCKNHLAFLCPLCVADKECHNGCKLISEIPSLFRKSDMDSTLRYVLSDMSNVIDYCKQSVTSLDEVCTKAEIRKQNIKTNFQKIRQEALKIIEKSENQVLENVNALIEYNKQQTENKKRKILDLLQGANNLKGMLEEIARDGGMTRQVQLKECMLKNKAVVEKLNNLAADKITFMQFNLVKSSRQGLSAVALENVKTNLTLPNLPDLKFSLAAFLSSIQTTLNTSVCDKHESVKSVEKLFRREAGTVGETNLHLPNNVWVDTIQSSDEFLEDSEPNLQTGPATGEKERSNGIPKTDSEVDQTATRQETRLKDPLLIFDFSKDIIFPNNERPKIEHILSLQNGSVVISDSAKSRLIFVSKTLEYITDLKIRKNPGHLAELNRTTVLVCIRNTDKIAVVSTDRSPIVLKYVDTVFHPLCVLVIDTRTIFVSLRDGRGWWHFVEMKAGDNNSFVQTRELQHTFRSGYSLCLSRGGNDFKNLRVVQCCQEGDFLSMFDMMGHTIFRYEIENPRQSVVDNDGNIFVLTQHNGIHVLKNNGSLIFGLSTNKLRGSYCFSLNSDSSKLYVGKYGNPLVLVYNIARKNVAS